MTTTSMTAQQARQTMTRYGFIPLVRIDDAEHWVRDGQRIVLHWRGDFPEQAGLDEILFATFVSVGDEWTLSVH